MFNDDSALENETLTEFVTQVNYLSGVFASNKDDNRAGCER